MLAPLAGTFSWTLIADKRVYDLWLWKCKALEEMHFCWTSRACFYSWPFWPGYIYKVLRLKGNKLLLIYMKTESLGREGFHLTAWSVADRGTYKQLFYLLWAPSYQRKKTLKCFWAFTPAQHRTEKSEPLRKNALCTLLCRGVPFSNARLPGPNPRATAHPARSPGPATWEVGRHCPGSYQNC